MWIPRPAYEAMPYVCVAAGAGLIVLAFRVDWGPHGLLFGVGGGLVTLGLVLWMKRRDYRSTQSAYDPRSLDE
ncbi:MAG TPA: hypothetical protein VF277_05530 [Steroidobacteraceae bacterium]